jgi:hypothetical protein
MAQRLTLQEVRNYPVDGQAVNLEKLAEMPFQQDWRSRLDITDLNVGQVAMVNALGGWRLGVIVKLGRTKVTVALTTPGAINEAQRFGSDIRVQASSYHLTDVRVAVESKVEEPVAASVEEKTPEAVDMTGSWPVVARGVAQVPTVEELDALAQEEDPERYGLEVLGNGQVAITDAWRGSWAGILGGAYALEVATRSVQRMNREMIGLGGGRTPGRHDYRGHVISAARVCQAQVGVRGGGSTPCLLSPEDPCHRPAPMAKVRPGDVVTIHRGTHRWEVTRLELDAYASGERLDYAQVVPVDEALGLEPTWINLDMLHVVETSAGDTGVIQFARRRLEREVRDLKV